MKIYIGTDILKISRIKEKYIKNNNFIKKIFTEDEINYCVKNNNINFQSLAGIFSTKEAAVKAFSKAFNESFSINDFEIIHKNKIPYLNLLKDNLKRENIHTDISISHEKDYAQSTIILYIK